MHLMGRTNELHVHGPTVLEEILRLHLQTSQTYLRYPLHFHALVPASAPLAWEDDRVTVTLLPLRHRLPTTGFVFTERPGPRNLRRDRLATIPTFRRNAVKAGEDLVLSDGTRIPNAELTLPPHPQRRYAYCSDTAPVPGLADRIRGVDLLYHEATFTTALADRAKETLHSTAAQAAELARDAGVGRLLLGHFSSRYPNTDALLAEARTIFPLCDAAEEGAVYPLIPRTTV
jgi:ribonuclease Z